MNLRTIKDIVLNNEAFSRFLFRAVNFPIVGSIYDFFYFKLIQNKLKKLDLILAIEPSNVCNLRCIFCPYKRMKRKKEVMNMDLFKSIVKQASEIGCKIIFLQQYNEPFLDNKIFERIDYIRKINKEIKIYIYSNATKISSDMISKILESPPDLIRFSIDGATKETFEKIRVGADYSKVVKNVCDLVRQRDERGRKLPRIETYFTVFNENRKEINSFLGFWKDKCDYASLYPADSRESENFVEMNYLKLKKYVCFNPKSLFVLSNGLIVPCCIDVDGELALGNLKKDKLKNIINSKKFKEFFNSQFQRRCKTRKCLDCSRLYLDSAFSWWAY